MVSWNTDILSSVSTLSEYGLNSYSSHCTFSSGGGGKYGAEKYVKEFCLEFGIQYQEIPPFHYKWNQYCILPEHKYNKKYNMKHYFVQNKIIVDSVDLVVFFESGEETTKLKDLKRYTEKQKKSLVIKS